MQWFKHDSNANLDEKLQEILLDYGLEGYGLYWYCLELIVNKIDKDNINFELKHDARIIARNTGCSVLKVQEMMKRFCDIGLFQNSDGKITCLKIAKRLDASMTSNEYMRSIISKSKESHDKVMTLSRKPMQEEIRIDKIRLEENRIEETRLEKIILKTSIENPIDNGFLEFWNYYPKKVGKDSALKAWLKKKPKIDAVINALEWQKDSEQWRNGYIPNPATYINEGRWQDEPQQKLVRIAF